MPLLKPIITERSMADAAGNRFTFKVKPAASKTEIKKTAEKIFGVKVLEVHTVKMPGKTYRTGKRWLKRERPDGKKAILTVEKGKTIDLFETSKQEK